MSWGMQREMDDALRGGHRVGTAGLWDLGYGVHAQRGRSRLERRRRVMGPGYGVYAPRGRRSRLERCTDYCKDN